MKKAFRILTALTVLLLGAVSCLAYADVIKGAAQVPASVADPGVMVLCGTGMLALAIYHKRRNNG
ncbi:hypothetical protein [Geomesophilobacter sediminis]|uniref:PEP-CTERM protein-sorting domain-containing protein n=1 Tax=Geomesophilobacter sediminis TaxID=2798584 RepID=A0A8J7INJ6_9BACT|nr:hypothetical protein [Geomesophilobacter sediminis]MBJ6723649.1 hypothetical protein [Geomesophilobacter sediminis]